METINPEFIDMYRGDTQKFDVSPGTLPGGFNVATDTVRFTAQRGWEDPAPEISLSTPDAGVEIISDQIARVTIPPADTDYLPMDKVEMHFGVEVVRGSEQYTLLGGTMIVKPVVR
jgi:hypothetical protein